MAEEAGPTFVGVDGCRGGWFAVELGGPKHRQHALVARAEELIERFPRSALILIDIPIGLPPCGSGPRACDRAAALRLGPRRSSVFPAPCREILSAGDYAAALTLSRRLTGKGLSKQAWNIGPRVLEVDRWLEGDPSLRERVREAHPEVCFQSLNRGRPMLESKRREAGFRERLALLQRLYPSSRALVEQALAAYPRRQLARDDILDALVCALAGWLSRGRPGSLPSVPERDARGLRMEICYPLMIE